MKALALSIAENGEGLADLISHVWHTKHEGKNMLTIRYYDRAQDKSVEIEIPADVVALKIPAQEEQRPLEVNVNTDAVLVDTADGRRLGMLTYTDLIAGAAAD